MANADGSVLPKPGVPKTLGILNVIFGVMLVLLGSCMIGMTVVSPMLLKGVEKIGKEAQANLEAQQKAQIKNYDDRIAAATTEDEKKAIAQEKANVIAVQPKMNPMDMSAATDILENRTVMGVSYASYFSNLILHIMLLVSGIGLIRLTPWGRSLALWWAGLQLIHIIAFLVISIVVVMPVSQASTDKQIAKLEAQAKEPGPAGQMAASTVQMTKVMAALAIPMAVGQSIAFMVYPAIVLILLNKATARAACLAKKKPEELDGF